MNQIIFRPHRKRLEARTQQLIEDITCEDRDLRRKDSAPDDLASVWSVEIFDFWYCNEHFNHAHYFSALLERSSEQFFDEGRFYEPRELALVNRPVLLAHFAARLLKLLFGHFDFLRRSDFWRSSGMVEGFVSNLFAVPPGDFASMLHVYIIELFYNVVRLVGFVHSSSKGRRLEFCQSAGIHFGTINCKVFLIQLLKVRITYVHIEGVIRLSIGERW